MKDGIPPFAPVIAILLLIIAAAFVIIDPANIWGGSATEVAEAEVAASSTLNPTQVLATFTALVTTPTPFQPEVYTVSFLDENEKGRPLAWFDDAEGNPVSFGRCYNWAKEGHKKAVPQLGHRYIVVDNILVPLKGDSFEIDEAVQKFDPDV